MKLFRCAHTSIIRKAGKENKKEAKNPEVSASRGG
jgi:hypothetical protein